MMVMLYWLSFLILSKIDFVEQTREHDYFKNAFEHYLRASEEIITDLSDNSESLQFCPTNQRFLWSRLTCLTCIGTARVIIRIRRFGTSKDTIMKVIVALCQSLITTVEVCQGLIEKNIDTFLYIIDNNKELTATGVCGILLQSSGGCIDRNQKNWTITIPQHLPSIVKDRQARATIESRPIKILQLSDVHYDPEYESGSNAVCGLPMCCRKGSKPKEPENAAGKWGDYRNCDIPWQTITNTIDHIKAQHKDLDFIYFTGDITDHRVWITSICGNSKVLSQLYGKLKESFTDVSIFPVIGNHEPHPVNVFAPEKIQDPQISTKWVFHLAAEAWNDWLPAETRETILKGGYYTVLVKKGFRIISLNSNVCLTYNWWLMDDTFDPYNQLNWLVKVLEEAEKNGEIVHIVSHVPSGQRDCLFTWNREYVRIVTRFSHIIAAQFNGHTHYDEMVIFFDNPTKKAINVAFNGGSLTPWIVENPNYKIYTVDANTMEVLDFETWTFDLLEANQAKNDSLNWYKLYSFKEAYNVNTLQPCELAELVNRMARSKDLTDLYFRLKHRKSKVAIDEGCDAECDKENLCNIVTFHPEYTDYCDSIKKIYDERSGT